MLPETPSSRRSEPSGDVLFGGLYRAGRVGAELDDRAWLSALLEFEAAVGRAAAASGDIPDEAAAAIGQACRAENLDAAALGARTAQHATPVVALVDALRAAVGEPYAGYVHRGATSQDAIDSAAMLVSRRALNLITDDARTAARAAAELARAHRATPMIGRTLLQPALPVSFGLVSAGWAWGIARAATRVSQVSLVVQLGGPVGSGPPELAAAVAAELGLAEPALPWHTIRVPPAELAGALGELAGVLGKVARDITLLSEQEIGELREGHAGRGGSSTMAHKRNPVAAVSVLACAKRVPGLVATMLAAMEQEHQRAAGAWQAEWGTLTELLGLTGSAAAWARDMLASLEVDEERMAANLARAAAGGIAAAADPQAQLGAADELIDRALAEL